jgi:pyridoxine 5-phosphate synthase
VTAAPVVEMAGADGIVVHLREDRRHIQDRDLTLLRQIVQTKLNLEMAATEAMTRIAIEIKPHLVTLVPERREELTTEGGLDVEGQRQRLKEVITLLHQSGVAVSLFVDPVLEQIKAARRVEADCVELHTGRYANAVSLKEQDSEFEALAQAGRAAYKLELAVSAGHGLNYHNVRRLRAIGEIVEYNIGHSIIARAVFTGLERAVRDMKERLR